MDGRIIIYKAARRLELWRGGDLRACFPIGLGPNSRGAKTREGDGRTPEGAYFVCTRNRQSKYYLSLGLSYPGERDALRALERGLIGPEMCEYICARVREGLRPPWDTPLGGFIMIHGGGAHGDWTQGCVALENKDMDALWACCPLGAPVDIRP